MTDVIAAVDLSGASAAILPILILAIGLALSFKGVDLGKRAVRKA